MKNTIPVGMPAEPLVGMVAYDPIAHMMKCYTGTTWVDISVGNPDRCVVCKRVSHELTISQHEMDYLGLKFDHPFLRNNLEYLEWEDAKRNGTR